MRLVSALLGVAAVALLVLAWRGGSAPLEAQAKVDAALLISSAEHVMALREDKRIETLQRAAAELSGKKVFAPENRGRLKELLASTSFGASLMSAVLVDETAEKVWAGGPSSGKLQLELVSAALLGTPGMMLLPARDPLILQLRGAPIFELPGNLSPYVIVVAPIAGSTPREVAGAVVAFEQLGPDFFRHLADLTQVGVSLPSVPGGLGVVPKEALAADEQVRLFDSAKPPVFAQKIRFRARGVVLGEAVAAVDASGFVERSRKGKLFLGVGVFLVVALTLLSVLRRP